MIASVAAFRDGAAWLDGLLAHLDRNRRLLGELLARELPAVGYAPPEASFLAWLDCRALSLGDDPAQAFLERGRVALTSGRPTDRAAPVTLGSTWARPPRCSRRRSRACGGHCRPSSCRLVAVQRAGGRSRRLQARGAVSDAQLSAIDRARERLSALKVRL